MNRRFPSDLFFPQKEQTGSKSEPEPDRSQDTTRVRRIGVTLAGVVLPGCTFWKSDRGDAPIPPLTRAKARLARTATPTSSFSVPVPA